MKPIIVIVTGLSGSGKTVVLRALEDFGFFCVDNLPPQLIDAYATLETGKGGVKKIAVSIDIREKEFLQGIEAVLPPLREKYNIEVLFLEAETDILLRRFKETRRPHPLGKMFESIEDAINKELELLKPLISNADRILDTSTFTPHQLRHFIITLYGLQGDYESLSITLLSFGFKYGIPNNVDLIFDVRFLPNPHFIPELKDLNGTDLAVQEFVMANRESKDFLRRLYGFLDYLIPLYKKEGRAYLSIGIGCTGGKHRSPTIAEMLKSAFESKQNLKLNVVHRDI